MSDRTILSRAMLFSIPQCEKSREINTVCDIIVKRAPSKRSACKLFCEALQEPGMRKWSRWRCSVVYALMVKRKCWYCCFHWVQRRRMMAS